MSAARKLVPSYKSKVEWLPIRSIDVDLRIQRPIDRGWVKRLADQFDPDAFGFPVVVSVPDGKQGVRYFVVDGQHRLEAAKLALGDDQSVECEVVHGVTLQQAAKIFGQRNSVRLVKAVDRFLVGVTQGDEECVAINQITTSLGLVIDRQSVAGRVSAVAALQRVYRGDKSKGTGRNALALKRTLGTALNAWGRTAEAMNGQILDGLGSVVLRYGDVIDFEALERKLRQFKGGALGLLGAARGLKDSFGGSVANCVAHQIVILYNRGRVKHPLQDWNRAKEED